MHVSEKDAMIKNLKGKLGCEEGEENQPSMDELNNNKEKVKIFLEKEEQKSREASSWQRSSPRQKKVDEAKKWIEGAKKGKDNLLEATLASPLIDMTKEEELKRKTRALMSMSRGSKTPTNS